MRKSGEKSRISRERRRDKSAEPINVKESDIENKNKATRERHDRVQRAFLICMARALKYEAEREAQGECCRLRETYRREVCRDCAISLLKTYHRNNNSAALGRRKASEGNFEHFTELRRRGERGASEMGNAENERRSEGARRKRCRRYAKPKNNEHEPPMLCLARSFGNCRESRRGGDIFLIKSASAARRNKRKCEKAINGQLTYYYNSLK